MDNSNFEDTFRQNVKDQALQTAPAINPGPNPTEKKPFPIATIILGVALLVESIALVIVLTNYFTNANEGSIVSSSDTGDGDMTVSEADDFKYDKDLNLVAMNLVCANSQGASITLDTSNNYTYKGADGASDISGSYNIVNDSLISLPEADKVLYYDGFGLADRLDIYSCK